MTRAHSDLRVEDITAICDTREQAPLDLSIKTVVGKLSTADYSVVGLEKRVAIERKSLPDLLRCVGRERDRFESCVMRMRAYEMRAIVIEASWGAIRLGQWRSQLTPKHVLAALCSWMKHMSVIVAGDRETAGLIISGLLVSAARERWNELQPFAGGLKLAGSTDEAS